MISWQSLRNEVISATVEIEASPGDQSLLAAEQ
jgi:hypothetical protein